VEKEKQFTKKGRKHRMTTVEKIHEFSLLETIRALNAGKIMNIISLKCFIVFTFFHILIESYPGLPTRNPVEHLYKPLSHFSFMPD